MGFLFVCDGFNTKWDGFPICTFGTTIPNCTPLLAVIFDSSQTLKIPRSLLRLGFLFYSRHQSDGFEAKVPLGLFAIIQWGISCDQFLLQSV